MSWDSRIWLLLELLVIGASVADGVAVQFSTVNDTTSSATSSSDIPSTITSAASLPPWGTSAVPLNTCSYTTVYNETVTETLWNEPWCSLAAGTVQLHFWPTSDNKTYPATVYDSELDYTFTSPSVYMIINTLHASNECGPLGPAPTSAIFAFDLTDVSTLVPYTDASETSAQSSRQLHLSDLGVGCSQNFNISKIQTQTHYTKDAAHRCNPRLAVPIEIKRYGYPYWKHCSNVGYRFGLFDPPYAFSPAGGLLPTNSPPSSPNGPTSTTQPGASGHDDASPPTTSTATGSDDDDNIPPPPPPPASVTTVSKQIVSLGPSGVVVINEDGTNAPTTSTYGVPAFGATGQGSNVPQASVVVYQNQTLTLGGPAATISGAVVVLPTSNTSTKPSGVPTVMTGDASRGMTRGLIGLGLSIMAMVCLG
ncbi:hypothetical protein GQ53DRAFT_810258 [Thozetella sp. PMI_491]|nr:hypothetical protein GQ53DRAFT_810258 [Thozetella sp. PMI_491]